MEELAFSRTWYWFLLMAVVCYLIGSINFSTLVSRLLHRDIRKEGSGNPGTMNMFRTFGWGIGLLIFFLDAFKGGIPALISYFIFRRYYFVGTEILVSDLTRYLCGAAVIVGHIFPCFMKFKGGKGIASTLGLFWLCMACEEVYFLAIGFVALAAVLAYIALTKWGSMGSLLGVTGFSIWQCTIFFLRYETCLTNPFVVAMFLLIILLNILTWVAHHLNLRRLLSGEEHFTEVIKKKKKV